MKAIPRLMAPRTDGITVALPAIEIVPESGWSMPPTIFISVDFPAPFSPIRATISLSPTWRSTESRAVTPGNLLVIDFISSKADAISLGLSAAPKLVYSFSEFVDIILINHLGGYEYLF